MPRISVLTAVKQSDGAVERLGYLAEAWESLRAQDVDFEWIIAIDRGRVDDTVFLQDFLGRDPRITVVDTVGYHVSAGGARNIGLSLAKGEYVAALDSDDLLPDGAYAKMLAYMDDNPDFAWAASYLGNIDADGTASAPWKTPAVAGAYAPGDIFDLWSDPQGHFPIAVNTLFMRRQHAIAVGGWQGLTLADQFGLGIAITSAFWGGVIGEVLYNYRNHGGQQTKDPRFFRIDMTLRRAVFQRGQAMRELGANEE